MIRVPNVGTLGLLTMQFANGLIPYTFVLGMESTSSSSMRAESGHSEQGLSSPLGGSEPEVFEAVRFFTRNYRVDGRGIPQFSESEGIEGIDYPAVVVPLRLIGPNPDIINIDEEFSEKADDEPNEGENGEDEGGADDGASERETADKETPAASSSRVHEEIGAIAKSSY